jgi:hypothetical protein
MLLIKGNHWVSRPFSACFLLLLSQKITGSNPVGVIELSSNKAAVYGV